MSTPARLSPRLLFVGLGLALTALGLWRDRDLPNALAVKEMFVGDPYSFVDVPEAVATPTGQLYEAVRSDDAAATFTRELPQPSDLSLPPESRLRDREQVQAQWEAYRAARDAAWPAYELGVLELIATCDSLSQREPDNGVHQATAALAELELALAPSPAEYLLVTRIYSDRVHGLDRFQIRDPQRLESALARLEGALAAPRFDFGGGVVNAQLDDLVPETLPLETFARRLGVKYSAPLPNLITLRSAAKGLCLVARHYAHVGGGDPQRPLRVARQLGLRLGAEASSLIELMMGQAVLGLVDEEWLHLAATAGDSRRAQGISEEQLRLERAYSVAHQLSFDPARLGRFDAMLVPAGGYSPSAGYDPDLGRTTEHSVWESIVLWGVALVALLLAGVSALRARTRLPAEAPLGAAWTLGDVLGLVLPSFGAAAAAGLLLMRLHPARGSADTASLVAHTTTVLVFAAVAFPWLLRGAALRKLGLDWTRTKRARWAVGVFLAGAYLATAWVGPGFDGDRLLPLAWGLQLVGFALGAWVYRLPGADPTLKRALWRTEGRVGLIGLGMSLALIASLQLLAVAPRRDRLVRDYTTMQVELDEAQAWGDGDLQDAMRTLLVEAADGPKPRGRG